MCEHTAFSPHAVLCERVDVTREMLASEGIIPIRRNHRDTRTASSGATYMISFPAGDPIASHATFGLLLTLVSTLIQHTSVRYGPGEQ